MSCAWKSFASSLPSKPESDWETSSVVARKCWKFLTPSCGPPIPLNVIITGKQARKDLVAGPFMPSAGAASPNRARQLRGHPEELFEASSLATLGCLYGANTDQEGPGPRQGRSLFNEIPVSPNSRPCVESPGFRRIHGGGAERPGQRCPHHCRTNRAWRKWFARVLFARIFFIGSRSAFIYSASRKERRHSSAREYI